MSRGGRGGGRGTAVTALASALGIQRHELGAYNQGTGDARTALYPPLPVRPVPVISNNDDVQYMVEAEAALLRRYKAAPTYLTLHKQGTSSDGIRRYTDKYRKTDAVRYTPAYERLPRELHSTKRGGGPSAKRRRVDQKDVFKKLDAHMSSEQRAGGAGAQQAGAQAAARADGDVEVDVDEADKPAAEDAELAAVSDDDYFEEANDYVQNYFDNGENYGESDSGDNLDDDAVF